MLKRILGWLLAAAAVLAAEPVVAHATQGTPARLVEVATSPRRWTGLAVTPAGRLFVNFPRWSRDVPVSVAEVVDGRVVPWPDSARNAWAPGGDSLNQFVCVQALLADSSGSLWVLDPASPGLAGVVEGGAKLMRFDAATGALQRAYRYAAPVMTPASYLNDVRVDLAAGVAYLTDSGDGAIIVTDLETGASRRLLDDDPSTEAEDVVLTVEGRSWLQGGERPRVHADGIALSDDGRWLYYQALTGRTLYRVATAALRDRALDARALGARVETMGRTGAADGLIVGADGKVYISSLEENAITRFDPATRHVEVVVRDPRIKWPDSFARDAAGRIWFTTAQIHLGGQVTEPFRVFRIE